nr:beta-D-glucosyl crocetin beta-1,6-glucosyltransferase-like [Ipomoea batatas]
MSTETVTRSVVMFPWLAYGHITPFLGLAKNLVDLGFLIQFCPTPVNLNSIKNNIPQAYSQSIRLVELHLPETPHLPPHYQTCTNGLPRYLHDALKEALKMAAPDFAKILKTLNLDLIIHDIMQPWVVKLALLLHIPAVPFFTSSAAAVGFYFSHVMNKSAAEFPFPALLLRRYEQTKTLQLLNRAPPNQQRDDETELMDWLGRKPARSTVLVSFGSEYFLSKEDTEEIAYTLELSNPESRRADHRDANAAGSAGERPADCGDWGGGGGGERW